MTRQKLLGRWLIAPALFLACCSKGSSPSTTGPSNAPAMVAGVDGGSLGISAAGDVRVGTGALDFLNLAIWGFNGDPGAGSYINPGGSYRITAGVEVKLWATYVEGSPANPKFMVEWGDGSEQSASGCGACKVTHTYARPGLYAVKATLDDRVSTMVTRTFQLDARAPTPTPTPSPSPSPSPTGWIVTGVQNYNTVLNANGTYGIQQLKYDSATFSGSVYTIYWPVVFIDGGLFSGGGTPTNGYWHGLHSGCGNQNGVATCTSVCRAIDLTYVAVNTNCSTNYPTTNMNANGRNLYMGNSSGVPSGVWDTYQPNPAIGNGNNMEWCSCSQ